MTQEPSKEAIEAARRGFNESSKHHANTWVNLDDALKAAYAIDFAAHQQAMQREVDTCLEITRQRDQLQQEVLQREQAMQEAQAEIARLKKRGRSGCACVFDVDDDEKLIESCKFHAERAQALEVENNRLRALWETLSAEAFMRDATPENVASHLSKVAKSYWKHEKALEARVRELEGQLEELRRKA